MTTPLDLAADLNYLERYFRDAPGFVAVTTGKEHVVAFVNRAWRHLVGDDRDVMDRPLAEAVPEFSEQGFVRLLDNVRRDASPFAATGMSAYLSRDGGSEPEQRFFDFVYQPVMADDGSVAAIVMEGFDVTEQKTSERALLRSEAHLQTMLAELNHRVKNTMAIVLSMSAQTARTAKDLPDFLFRFQNRLLALSRAHDALTRGNWEGADLRQILEQELGGSRARATMQGEDLKLGPKAAVAVGLAAHELATNAARFGALSNQTGEVHIAWAVQTRADGGTLHFHWRETGGPAVQAPQRRGFGTLLLERSASGHLGTAAHLEFPESGFCCDLEIPLENVPVSEIVPVL